MRKDFSPLDVAFVYHIAFNILKRDGSNFLSSASASRLPLMPAAEPGGSSVSDLLFCLAPSPPPPCRGANH